jgi:DNA-binding beta-propeller fold protein YncE
MTSPKILCSCFIAFFLFIGKANGSPLAPTLPNGLTLDPAGTTFDVGNMPLSGLLSRDGKLVLLLSGFRQQGVQVVDLDSRRVLQTIPQPSAFLGLAFSSDGKTLFASGATEDVIYVYNWKDGAVELNRKIALATVKKPDVKSASCPAGIAISPDDRFLFVAENVSDSFAVVNVQNGTVVDRKPAGHFPYEVVATKEGTAYVSAWGENIVMQYQIDPSTGKISRSKTIPVVRHPSAMLLNKDGTRLFIASGSTDSIAVINTKTLEVITTLKDAPPGVQEGSTPNALALSADGTRLYVAEADNNAIAVFELSDASFGRLIGRVPVGWYPTDIIQTKNRFYILNGKGRGTRANPKATHGDAYIKTPSDYTLGQLNGTVTELPVSMTDDELASHTKRVAELNNWNRRENKASYPPFKHVLYIIKENRTYDQMFGDLPQGDGDPSLLFFPRTVSPNHHALAERFGLYDRFFVNAEVSSQGHPWSTSAYVTDFTEKTVHSTYSDRRDGEASDDEVSDPATGYLWDLAARAKISLRIYGEYAELSPGSQSYHSTKKGAADYTSPIYPAYDLTIQDQTRVEAWMAEFKEFVKLGKMPVLQIFHLPNDHTAGAKEGMPTPAAMVADNDLAVGRLIETLSHSPFWKDTVVFILEDDAQSGPDHVDSHRSILLLVSAYNKKGVYHRFVNTTDVIATMEQILGLGSLSQFDYFGRPLKEIFSDKADLTPYKAITPQQSLTEKNPKGKAAEASELLELEKEDRSDDEFFNRILWAAVKGKNVPFPEIRTMSMMQIQQER